MTISDLIPGATYAIESVDDKGLPWKGRAVYVGPETSEHYPEGTLEFICEDGMGGMFQIEEVKTLLLPPTIHATFRGSSPIRVGTFGGYSNIDDLVTDDFGIQLYSDEQVVSVSGLPAHVLAALVCIAADHLCLNGYRFKVQETGEQDLRRRLVVVSPKP